LFYCYFFHFLPDEENEEMIEMQVLGVPPAEGASFVFSVTFLF